ncbi:MAG: hypothetical protein ISN28_12305 [Ectothiorhodospiraceae bacterium AqS1]|nr:hypothetical protein [Ectothiorhodospiraceae bacterium AqS1]MBF2761021.1 hypothetical protein [Ectothiorhodospiraceae bacterium AqS1]
MSRIRRGPNHDSACPGGCVHGNPKFEIRHDNDSNDEVVTFRLSATSAPTRTCQITIDDDEVAGSIVVTPSSDLTVTEGNSTTLSVKLGGGTPASNVTVSLSKGNSDITLSPSSLTFTPSNRTTAKTVTVRAGHDSDKNNDTDTITLRASGGKLTASNVTKRVNIIDDDVNITPFRAATTLVEGQRSDCQLGVRLDGRPSSDVTARVTSNDNDSLLTIDTDTGTAGFQDTLTFNQYGSNVWSSWQCVRIHSLPDDDAQDNQFTITLTGAGGNIQGKTATFQVNITDDEEVGLELDSTSLEVGEGEQDTFKVRLDTRPSENATLNLTTSNSLLTVSPATLTFNKTGSAWADYQTVTVNALHDDDVDNESFTVNLRGASGSGDYVNVSSSLSVDVIDEDDPSGTIDITPAGTLEIDEDDASGGRFQINLSVKPKSNVNVSFSASNPDLIFSKSSLTFTPSNYANLQTMYVSATSDDDALDETGTVTFSVASGRIIAPNVTRTVSIIDDEPPPGDIEVGGTAVTNIDEGDAAGYNLPVKLSVKPKSSVNVSVSTSDSDITLSPSSLTFTTSNYATAQNVTVTAGDDDDISDKSASITFSVTSGRIVASDVTRTINIDDDDEPGLTLSVNSLVAPEGTYGTSRFELVRQFSVRPTFRPSADITVTVTASDPLIDIDTESRLLGSQNTLTFSPDESKTDINRKSLAWNKTQLVTVTTRHDDDANDDSFQISVAASGGGYDGTTASLDVSVIDDDPPPGDILLSSRLLQIPEGGSDDLSLSLRPDPNATSLKEDVTIIFTSEESDITFSPSSLVFTPSNYSTEQSFSVNVADDTDFKDSHYTITLKVSDGGMVASPTTAQVISIDQDVPPAGNIIILDTPKPPPIAEGESVSLGLSLSKAPFGYATVSLSSDIPEVIISPPTLAFTPSNYSLTQSFSITAREDDNTVDESALITIEMSGGGLSASRIFRQVSIVDNDVPEPPPLIHNYDGKLIIVPEGDLEIDEGKEGTFDIRLETEPLGDVMVRISKIADTSGVGFSHKQLIFTPSNWEESQAVRIIAHKDSDSDDIIHTFAFAFEGKRVLKDVVVNDTDRVSVQAQALALPPTDSGDDITLRIKCRQSTPCNVIFDCSAQSDGSIYQGRLPDPIPPYQAMSFNAYEIQRFMGGKSWAGKGRLGCLLRGDANIGVQVWTRSGNGVLVNNSALIRSVRIDGVYRADIESIPSPDSSDESNIRIRCNSDIGDCVDTTFLCYSDSGRMVGRWNLGDIARRTTRHLQSETLAAGLAHRWEEMGLSCEVSSEGEFTVQVLTRTGGGGALVNNSASGGG